jgi:hypothetical protein
LTAISETILAMFIVKFTLLWVAEHFIGYCYVLELFWVTSFIGVFLDCNLSERLLDLVLRCVLLAI